MILVYIDLLCFCLISIMLEYLVLFYTKEIDKQSIYLLSNEEFYYMFNKFFLKNIW